MPLTPYFGFKCNRRPANVAHSVIFGTWARLQVGPPIRSVPDLRHDLGFRRRLLAAILAGRREA
jgi:hypothetical protein